jgi:hypothetical protein
MGARIRVTAASGVGIACYGASFNPLHLRPGAIGKIINILPKGASKPGYVKFSTPLGWTYAAEVLLRKSENPPVVWKDFGLPSEEALVVITRRVLDGMEIEHGVGI